MSNGYDGSAPSRLQQFVSDLHGIVIHLVDDAKTQKNRIDFLEAECRALRQQLKEAEDILNLGR